MTDLFERVVLPVASVGDAAASARAIAPYDPGRVVAVHVIEKAGGAPDKASVEQREEEAERIFAALEEGLADVDLETDLRYGTDVADTIFAAAADHDATAVVITPRGGSRWIQLLTGDVALDIVTETDRPVVVLPDVEDEAEGSGEGPEGTEGETATGEEDGA
jgi:nucleotide-binding universal stress UspA family protein